MAFVEEPLVTEPGSPPEGASPGNRTFYIAVGILGGLFVIGLLCIGAYAFFIQPGRRAAQQAQQAVALTANAEVALAQTQQAAATDTPPPTATTVPDTATPVIAATETATVPPTNTPAATDTNTPAAVAEVTGTRAGAVFYDE